MVTLFLFFGAKTMQFELSYFEHRCMWCDSILKVRQKRLYLQGGMIIELQLYCPKDGWINHEDSDWLVAERKTSQRHLT